MGQSPADSNWRMDFFRLFQVRRVIIYYYCILDIFNSLIGLESWICESSCRQQGVPLTARSGVEKERKGEKREGVPIFQERDFCIIVKNKHGMEREQ